MSETVRVTRSDVSQTPLTLLSLILACHSYGTVRFTWMHPKRNRLHFEDITINRPLRKYLKYASLSFLHT